MDKIKSKDLVIGTFVDMDTKKGSSLNGSELCFVVALENFDNFVKSSCNNNYKDLAILMRYEVSEQFASEFIDQIQDFKAPRNKNWYYRNKLQESMNSIRKITKFEPKVYKSKKNRKFMHLEGRKYKTQS